MAVTATITEHVYLSPALYLIRGTFAFTGNYVAGGEVPTYTGIKTAKVTPILLIAQGGGYMFELDVATGKLIIREGDNNNAADAPLLPIPVAAYPAGLTGATVYFQGLFKKA